MFTADPVPISTRVRRIAVLGDSTAVGLGDPLPRGGWRGIAVLLAQALGDEVELGNLSFTGARARCVREEQLPAALEMRPDVAVLIVGMNDTLRSDFDPAAMERDLDAVVGELSRAGAIVLTVRFHDHARVFRLPGPIRRALAERVGELNAVSDRVAARHRALVLDLDVLPGAYEPLAWSVDRLHPSELGHRMLARGFSDLLTTVGVEVPYPVPLTCEGGRTIGPAHHVAWLVFKGAPWLWRRGRDLLPYAAALILRDLTGNVARRGGPN